MTTVISSGVTSDVSSGETSSGYLILSGGTLDIDSGGSVTATTVANGGIEIVSAGGINSSGMVESGGEQEVFGSSVSASLTGRRGAGAGGTQIVESGGIADHTFLQSLGNQIVESGGTANFTTVTANCDQIVYGTAISSNISGGGVTVESGGVISNGLALYDGSLGVSGTAIVIAQVSAVPAWLSPDFGCDGRRFPPPVDFCCVVTRVAIQHIDDSLARDSSSRSDFAFVLR